MTIAARAASHYDFYHTAASGCRRSGGSHTLCFTIRTAKEAGAGSAYVEPEHLLLGVMRASEPAVSSALELHGLEQEFRAGRATSGQAAPSTGRYPTANASKRIVAYAAEEAARLKTWEIPGSAKSSCQTRKKVRAAM